MNSKKLMNRIAYFTAAIIMVGGASLIAPMTAHAQDSAGLPTKPVTLVLDHAPIATALDILFKSANLNYTIDPSITGEFTGDLKDVPFDVALRNILRSTTPALEYTVQDGVYQIKEPPPPSTEPAAAPTTPAQGTSYTGDTGSETKQAVVIYLNYINGALLHYVVGAVTIIPPLTQLMGSSNGSKGGQTGGMGGQGGMGGAGGFNSGGNTSFGGGGQTTTGFGTGF